MSDLDTTIATIRADAINNAGCFVVTSDDAIALCDEIDRLREENSALRIVELSNEVDRLRAIVEPLEKMLNAQGKSVDLWRAACGDFHVAPNRGQYVRATIINDVQMVGMKSRSWCAPTLADALRAACEAMGEKQWVKQ